MIVIFPISAQLLSVHKNLFTITASTWFVSHDRVSCILWRTLLLKSQPSTAHKLYITHSYSVPSSVHLHRRQMILILAADQNSMQPPNEPSQGYHFIGEYVRSLHYQIWFYLWNLTWSFFCNQIWLCAAATLISLSTEIVTWPPLIGVITWF